LTVDKIEEFVWVALHFQAQLADDIQAGRGRGRPRPRNFLERGPAPALSRIAHKRGKQPNTAPLMFTTVTFYSVWSSVVMGVL
jgi:hypothetical protein